MRISDWSPDVCSSDLEVDPGDVAAPAVRLDVDEDVDGHHQQALDDRKLQPSPFGRRFHHQRKLVPCLRGASGVAAGDRPGMAGRSEEHTSELQSLMRISYAVFCLKKKKNKKTGSQHTMSK